MELTELLRAGGAATTIIAAVLVAANWSRKVSAAGFMVFIFASMAWMLDGWIEGKMSLVMQNAVLLLVNICGVWRSWPEGGWSPASST